MALWKFGHFKLVSKIISKTIRASVLKLDELIGYDEQITWLTFDNPCTWEGKLFNTFCQFFLELQPFAKGISTLPARVELGVWNLVSW